MTLVWFCKSCRYNDRVDTLDDVDVGDTMECPDCCATAKVYEKDDLPEIIAELDAEADD